jgi:hypothetical protein
MNAQSEYVFGDSTPAPVTIDFIAFLRDVFDFAVEVLLKDAQAADAIQSAKQFSDATEAAIVQADALASRVVHALEREDVGNAESLPGRCAAKIRYGTLEVVRVEAEAARAGVATAKARATQAAASARAACEQALDALLLRQEVPGTIAQVTLSLDGANEYRARLNAHTLYGLSWNMALEIPASHPLASVLRLDRIVDKLELDAPEQAGWLHKEVKIRPLRFDRYHLAELTLGAAQTTAKVRIAADGTGPGFDLTFAHDSAAVRMVRVLDSGASTDDPYDVLAEDAQKLWLLHETLVEMVDDIRTRRKAPIVALLDGTPLGRHENPRSVVDRLVASIAPDVSEIAKRSLSPGELVLRRRIGDNLREEAFVTIAELEKKLEPLPPALRGIFAPLNLWDTTALLARASREAPGPLPPAPSPLPAQPTASRVIPRATETAPFPLLSSEPKVIVAGSDYSS